MNEQIVMLEKVASVLTGLNRLVVYTGGATIALYLDSVAAADVRPTRDVDCVVEVNSRMEYYDLSSQLRGLGLRESQEGPLCRWIYDDLIVDVMPTEPAILGFSNSWYKAGIEQALPYMLPSGMQILIFPAVYLLASKIEAFRGRGSNDFYGSHDLEDIMLLLDGCIALEDEVSRAAADVKAYIKTWVESEFKKLDEVAPAYLAHAAIAAGRDRMLRDLIRRLTIPEYGD
jgi:hypothetical protein